MVSRIQFEFLLASVALGLLVPNPVRNLIVPSSALAQPAQTVWNGAYTEEQAERGGEIFVELCETCHGSDLMGVEGAPPLIGDYFLTSWDDLPVWDLFERTRISMPQDSPGSLTRQQYADVLAFLLFKSDFPPGKTELPSQAEPLKLIQFLATKP